MTTGNRAGDGSLWWRPATVFWAALAYCASFLILRNLLSQTITVDDVEQIIVVQHLGLGYRVQQPPLHAWLLWGAAQLVGPGLLALSLVKYGSLFATILFYYGAARRLFHHPMAAVLATASLALIYLISYKIHRGYTHSAVLLPTCAAAFYFFVVLRERRSPVAYGLFGLAVALAILSKYNAVPFVVALLIGGLATPEWRRAVLNRRMLLSLTVFAVVTLPYLYWALVHAPVDLGSLVADRMPDPDRGFLASRAAGVLKALESTLLYLLPFLVVVPLVFPQLLSRRGWDGAWHRPEIRLLTVLVLASLGFLLALVLVTGTSAFKGRHLHPLLMFTPILVFLLVEHKVFGAEMPLGRAVILRARLYLLVVAVAVVATAVALSVRAIQSPPDCGKCRMQRPYPALFTYLTERHDLSRGTVVTDDEFLGGNARAGFPEMRIYSLPYLDVTPPEADAGANGVCLVLWDVERSYDMPAALAEYVAQVRGADDLDGAEVLQADIPYRRTPSVVQSFRYVVLPPAGDCR